MQAKNLGGYMELKNMLKLFKTREGFMDENTRTELERRAVEIFEQKRIDKGISVDKLASKLYPNVPISNARMTLNRLRKPQVTGKPKRLLYGDFIDLCMVLELIPERVIAQTITDVIEKH